MARKTLAIVAAVLLAACASATWVPLNFYPFVGGRDAQLVRVVMGGGDFRVVRIQGEPAFDDSGAWIQDVKVRYGSGRTWSLGRHVPVSGREFSWVLHLPGSGRGVEEITFTCYDCTVSSVWGR